MRRLALALVQLVAVLSLLAAARPAEAGWGWCARDPIFSLDGKVGHVYLAVPEGMQHLNNSSSDVLIHHPFKAATKVIWIDPLGFGTGQGISVNFKETTWLQKTAAGYEIEIWVKVPMRDPTVPVLVEFAPAPGTIVTASTVGQADRWIVLRALLP